MKQRSGTPTPGSFGALHSFLLRMHSVTLFRHKNGASRQARSVSTLYSVFYIRKAFMSMAASTLTSACRLSSVFP